MRIGYDAKRIFHNFRGLGNYSRTLFEGVNKFYPNNDYFLYTPSFNDPRSLEWIKKYPNAILKTPDSFFSKSFSSAWRSLFLTNILKDDKLDIYHGLSHELPRGIEKLKCKKIVTIHDLIFIRYPELFPWIDRLVYMAKFKHSCQHADVIFAISQQTKNDIVEMFNVSEKKIKVVYQSCHYYFYNKESDEVANEILNKYKIDFPYILNVGAIEPRKNILTLVNAYARVHSQIEHKLVLIGNGKDYLTKVKELVYKLKLQDKIIILNGVGFRELPTFYQRATCFVFPALFEGFGLPIVESLFSKTPVILSSGSCFPEAAGESGLFVNPNDAEDIGAAILKMIDDDSYRINCGRKGRQFVEKFHWSRTSEYVMKLYSEMI